MSATDHPKSDADGVPIVTSYRPQPYMRYYLYLMFAIFLAAAVFVVGSVIAGSGPPWWFAVMWLAVAVWNGYWWLYRMCDEVVVSETSLSWRAPLRRGSVPLQSVTRVRGSLMTKQFAVIELDQARPLMVPVAYGFAALTAAIAGRAPHAVIEPN